MTQTSVGKIELAIVLATGAHVGQLRKYTGMPYVTHPIEVSVICAEKGGLSEDENALVAAILHDVVEDTPIPLEEIRREFGDDVAALVEELTEVPVEGNRAYRKEAERARLAEISARGQTIKLADLISNTRSIVEHDEGFAKVYLKEKQALLEVLTKGSPNLHKIAKAQVERALNDLPNTDQGTLGL